MKESCFSFRRNPKTRHVRLECYNRCFQSDRWSWKRYRPWNLSTRTGWSDGHGAEVDLFLQDLKTAGTWRWLGHLTYQFSKQVVVVLTTHPWPKQSSNLSNLIGWCVDWTCIRCSGFDALSRRPWIPEATKSLFNGPPADDGSRLNSVLNFRRSIWPAMFGTAPW